MVERAALKLNGFLGIIIILLMFGGSAYLLFTQSFIMAIVLVVAALILCTGLVIVQPNEARALTFFGRYIGSMRENSMWLDDERKMAMINNLLVAIVSDRAAQPVINTGSLY